MLARLAPSALAVAALLHAAAAAAAPIELVQQRRNYALFDDVDGTIEHANWFSRTSFFAAYRDLEAGFFAAHPDDSQFIVLFSTFPLVQGVGAFYQSLSNDVQGIGYEHAAEIDAIIPAPFFDDTPDNQVTGFLHLNDWRNYVLPGGVLDESWLSLIVGQELGHAWLSFVRFLDGGQPSTAMLGRALAHWSFYLHTGGSPVQGHDWQDNGDGTFTATRRDLYQFSDLDLYLMGLLPPEEVAPWFLIEDPTDCVDSSLPDKACAPPDAFQFKAETYTVSGKRRDLTIADVVGFEGPRVPAHPDAPTDFDVSFIVLKRQGEVLCDDELEQIEAIVERSVSLWSEQTRGLSELRNRTAAARPVPAGPSCGGDTTTGGETSGGGSTSSDPAETSAGSGTTAGQGDSTSDSGATSAGADADAGCACWAGTRVPALLDLSWLALAGIARRRRLTAQAGAAARSGTTPWSTAADSCRRRDTSPSTAASSS